MMQDGTIILYHRTHANRVRAILESGFDNDTGRFLGNVTWAGVWLSSTPDARDDSAQRDALLVVNLALPEQDLTRWEWIGEGRSDGEWLIPARIVNRYGTVKLLGPAGSNAGMH